MRVYSTRHKSHALYSSVTDWSAAGTKACGYVILPVVQDLTPKTVQRIVAFACVHIDPAVRGGGGKYIQIETSNNPDKCQGVNSGGVGLNYGAYTPARLVG